MSPSQYPLPTPTRPRKLPRSLQWALLVAGILWIVAAEAIASRAAQGIAMRFAAVTVEPLLEQGLLLLLLLAGFATLSWMATRTGSLRGSNSLPARPTTPAEWRLGVVIGWAMALLAVVPMMLAGALHPEFWFAPRAFLLTLLGLAALVLGTLVIEVTFRGFLFARLISAVGPVAATILLSLGYALLATLRPNSSGTAVLITFLFGMLLSLAYLRTHALWMSWGLHIGWTAALVVLLGLPAGGSSDFSNAVATTVSGPLWLTGGAYGPEGASLTVLVVLLGMAVLYRATRDYAWVYTQPEIVAGGFPMEVAPPAAHTAMESAAAARPAPLVQILQAGTPAMASTVPAIDDHLRARRDADSDDSGS